MIFASSRPTRRGIEGPVRSMSRMPTDLPCSESARASWRVTEDLPTPPLPERTCDQIQLVIFVQYRIVLLLDAVCYR